MLHSVSYKSVLNCTINFRYYGVVTLIPIFMYSNVYIPTPKLNKLADNYRLQDECVQYVARQGKFLNSIFS